MYFKWTATAQRALAQICAKLHPKMMPKYQFFYYHKLLQKRTLTAKLPRIKLIKSTIYSRISFYGNKNIVFLLVCKTNLSRIDMDESKIVFFEFFCFFGNLFRPFRAKQRYKFDLESEGISVFKAIKQSSKVSCVVLRKVQIICSSSSVKTVGNLCLIDGLSLRLSALFHL